MESYINVENPWAPSWKLRIEMTVTSIGLSDKPPIFMKLPLETAWHTSYVQVWMEKPGVSLNLKRVQKVASNCLHLFNRSQDKKGDQIHPVASDGDIENNK